MVIFATAILALAVLASLQVFAGMARLKRLADLPASLPASPPKVSIVIPACNEAATIEAAMASILQIDYPELEIIAINDRSSDETLTILNRLASRDARLRVCSIDRLPDRWLGKCHAMEVGRQYAQGTYLLFTDADVHFAGNALRRAVSYMEARCLDHLVAAPQLHAPTLGLKLFLPMYLLGFYAGFKPWLAADPNSKAFIGFGAFNLVRAETCRESNALAQIALCPDEDLKLGKVLKAHGAKQEALVGIGAVAVEWYDSLPAMIKGLEKNTFAIYDYSLAQVCGASVLLCLFYLLPAIALLLTGGIPFYLCAALYGVNVATVAGVTCQHDPTARRAYALLYPISAAVLLFMLWNSALSVLRHQGITWRGTYYPIALLKSGRRY